MNPVLSLEYSKYVGVPYLSKGRSPEGWDCYGLYWWIHRYIHEVLDMPSYSERYVDEGAPGRDTSVALALQHGCAAWQRVHEPQPGDCIVVNLAGVPMHCGLVIGDGRMLHCLRGRETVIERYTAPGWNKRIEGYYRWNS